MTAPATLLMDERGSPPLRARIGQLLTGADDAAFALARVRLAVLDLNDQELGGVQRCRVLLGQLDATMLMDAAAGATSEAMAGPSTSPPPRSGPGSPPGSAGALRQLLRFATSGRLEVRSAGLGGWAPDFAVVRRGGTRTGMVGSIQFGNPELFAGPTLTVVLEDPDATRLLQRRFDDLWARSHDVLPAIQSVIERASSVDRLCAPPPGDADPGRAIR